MKSHGIAVVHFVSSVQFAIKGRKTWSRCNVQKVLKLVVTMVEEEHYIMLIPSCETSD